MKIVRILLGFFIFLVTLESEAQLVPTVKKAQYFRKTRPIRDIAKEMRIPAGSTWKNGVIRNEVNPRSQAGKQIPGWVDPVLQKTYSSERSGGIQQNFEGINNIYGVLPPDTDGDVGLNYYVQMINLAFAVYDKSGNLVDGPYPNSSLWADTTGPWNSTNDGDPIVLYDAQADRWMMSQFSVSTNYPNGPAWELIAISVTNDPTGAYYEYAFQFDDFPDYPKFGVWNDAYYASFNIFGTYIRVAAAAFERDSMLIGSPNARMVLFDLPDGSAPWSMLPSDFDGPPPPAGTPNYFAYFEDGSPDALKIWEFHTDWNNTSNSTFAQVSSLTTASFDSQICNANRGQCIDQPDVTQPLEDLSDRLMFRLQYRNFGTYSTMVTNHTVDVGSGHAGIRWYELRKSGSSWSIYQQGTYAPDSDHRWVGSIAMNASGNILLGYSVSSSTTYPSIRYTGRLASDPLGQMTVTETSIIAGSGSQTNTARRWGDYSMMSVDPSDDNSFWFTTEYIQTTSDASWRTRIAKIAIDDGTAPPSVDFVADTTHIENGNTVSFTDNSSGSPTQWQWNFPGGTPASSVAQNPTVYYAENGTYDVILTAFNAHGQGYIAKHNYIKVYSDIFSDDFETDKGWSLTGEFQRDAPTGMGGEHGNPDPSSAYQGTNVLGVDLTGLNTYPGDYEVNIADRAYTAVSPSFDCSQAQNVTLSFMRWLNVEQSDYDHAYIDVHNSTGWHQVWANSNSTLTETSWSQQSIDISSFADGEASVQVRFCIGATDGSWVFSGWNIDDLKVSGPTTTLMQNVSWLGVQNDNWDNPANWSSGSVPDVNVKAYIPAFAPGNFMPSSFSNPMSSVYKLYLENGAEVHVTSGDTLTITGN